MAESRCGLLCSACSFREEMGCKGCAEMDKPFWADACPVKSCCEGKNQQHCGGQQIFACRFCFLIFHHILPSFRLSVLF